MHRRLIEIPLVHLTIWSFGVMMVVGAIAALALARRLSRRGGLDPEIMTNAAMYCVLVGVLGARTFFVVHYFDQFRGDPLGVVAVWRGGLEFVGGVIPAIGLLVLYLGRLKLPIRRYMDVMAIGLMMGLAFGRIGCFLNGCCFGRPTDLPWGIRFPYGSYTYISQINGDRQRARAEPYLRLPEVEYFSFSDNEGKWYPKDLQDLTEGQRYEVTKGRYRCLAVHPTQFYGSGGALLLCGILYAVWRKSIGGTRPDGPWRRLGRPGSTVGFALILYGVGRFLLECLRDDNPYEIGALTISQIAAIAIFVSGVVLLVVLWSMRTDTSGGRGTHNGAGGLCAAGDVRDKPAGVRG